jgi:YfiH family protein
MDADWICADWPAPGNIVAGTTLRDRHDFAFPAPPRWLKQVHGPRVVRIDADAAGGAAPEADAVVAASPGAICAVCTADCLPILLVSENGRDIGAAHAGWRGLAAGVAENTVAAMGSAPARLLAWLGPAISQPNFEVGAEVREAFIAQDPAAAAAFETNPRGRWQADLYLLARQRLAAAGVTRVFGGGLCTYADAERFYSYRRNRDTGRLVSFVYRAR